MDIGYSKKLYILPFDHRNTFAKKMYNVDSLSQEQQEEIKEFKQIIYDAFKMSCSNSVPKDEAAILVDEEYGDAVLQEALQEGYTVLYTMEKSGTKGLEFEYDNWQEHVEKYKPTFGKMLVRYNTGEPQEDRDQKLKVLKEAANYLHEHGYKFLVEPLVPALESQLSEMNGSQEDYDAKMRPMLTVAMIKEMQDAGIEVDVWKLEGFESRDDYVNVARQARDGGRDNVGVIILGRGAGTEKVDHWLRVGSDVDGVIGFAVGRTIFWQALEDYHNKKISREDAVKQISDNFTHFYNVFVGK